MLRILNSLKNIQKKILIPTTVVLAVALFVSLVTLNLEKTVEISTGLFFDFKVKTKNIEFKDKKIYVEKIELLDNDGKLMVFIPEASATYDSLLSRKVKEIKIPKAQAFIKRNKKKKINFVTAFYKEDKKREDKKEVMKNYKPSIYRFADKIIIDDIELNYEDLNYSKPIVKTINTSGELRFNDKNALEIYVKAKKNTKNQADIEYIFSNEKEPYSMIIKSKNIKFEKEWGQYIWDSPKLHYLNGLVSSDIKLSYLENFGKLVLKDGKLVYDDYEEQIKDIKLDVLFDEKNINIIGGYNIFNNKEKVNLTYTDKGLNIVSSLKSVDAHKILKYKPLQSKKLDLSEVNIKDIFLNYNYSKDKGSVLNIEADLDKSKFKNIIFKDFKLKFSSKDDKKSLKDSYILVNIFGMDEKIDFDMNKQKDSYDFIVKTNSKNNENLIPNLEAKIKAKNKKDKINLEFVSDLIKFEGKYLKEEKLLKLFDKNFTLALDNKNKFISFKQVKNIKNNLGLDAYYNFKNNDFNLEYDAANFNLEKKYKGDKIYLKFSGKGKIKKEGNVLNSEGEIIDLSGGYKGFIENLNAKYFTRQEDSKAVTELHGEIDKIGYSKYKLSGLKIDLGLKEKILKIFDIENAKLFTKGEINLKEKIIDLDFQINNLNNQDLLLDKLSFNLGSLKGSLFGNLKNPNSEVYFKDLLIDLEKYGKINSKGELYLKNKKITIPKIEVDKNKLSGNYDMNNGKYSGKINVFEENMSKFSSLKELRGRFISQINIFGNFSKEFKDFNAEIEGNLDRVFFKSKEIPNFYFKGKYSADNFINGVLEIEKLSILNARKKEIIALDGYADLNKKHLEISTKKNLQIIDISKLKRYLEKDYIKGNLLTNFSIKGKFTNPYYSLDIKSEDTKIKEVLLDKVEISLDGNLDRVNLKNLGVEYFKNKFFGAGFYNLKDKLYSLELKSNKLNFVVLNRFLKDKNIEVSSGNAALDFKLNSKNSSGFLKAYDLNLKIPQYNFKVSKLNSNIFLKGNKINIKNISSDLNEGTFEAAGFIEVPRSLDMFDKNILKNLNYSIETKLNNFEHTFSKVSNFLIHSNILLSNKKIEGAIYLDKGTIYDIPNNYKSIWRIISSFLFKKVEKKNRLEAANKKAEYELPDYLKDLPSLNLAIIMSNPLIIDMNNFTTFADEVKGKVYANLNLKGENGKFYILGSGEAQEAYLVLNSNKFILERALISFNDKSIFLPKFNPNIYLESKVNLNGDEMGFDINGDLKRLRYNIVSRNGSSNGELDALISDIKNGEVQTEINTPYYNLLKSLISDQITNTVFGGTSKKIKKMFKLSKFRLKSDITTLDINDGEYFRNKRNDSVNHFNINTILEVEDNIYKDKLFINASTKLFSTGTNLDTKYSKIKDTNIREYDVNLEYRYKDYSVGVGVGSIPQKYRISAEENYKEKNYHIDFKFRRKFNCFSELFSF